MASSQKKLRRSFTLSPESVAYLEAARLERQADSTSAVLDEILQDRQKQDERQRLRASISAYYDVMTDEEAAENQRWARLSESQVPPE
jgi:hypothetical protein